MDLAELRRTVSETATRAAVMDALERFAGNRHRVAKELKVDLRTVHRLIARLEIRYPAPPRGIKWADPRHPRPAA